MPNGDAAVDGVDAPKMEGEFAAAEVAPPPKIDTPEAGADAVVLVVGPPKERAEPKVCPKPDAAVVAAAAGAAPNAAEPAAAVVAADPKAGGAELKAVEAVEDVAAKTEEPAGWKTMLVPFFGIIFDQAI